MIRVLCRFLLLSSMVVGHAPAAWGADKDVPSELGDYVAKADSSFEWKLRGTQQEAEGKIYDLDLTSQTWQGIVWKHALAVYEPVRVQHPRHVLLYVTGGSNGDRFRRQDVAMGMALARYCGARVAVLNQVPNQPLFDGRKEDDLITETWLRYLADGDPDWPLLFPMVKSAVRAMDAIQAVAPQAWQGEVEGFVIAGGSKRGWTSWLAAVVDKRLIGTAPLVIDVLNFRPHMEQQLATWGKYSEQIEDYSSKGLIKQGDETPRERKLREMMDPYSYLPVIEIPKLLIHGTNDRYWCIDATRFYWDDIVGDKYVLKLPNDGHGLENHRDLALRTLGVFFRRLSVGASLPELSWERLQDEAVHRLLVHADAKPVKAQLWSTTSTTKDFRESTWRPAAMPANGKGYVGEVSRPSTGHFAYFGELQFVEDDLPFSLSTLVFWE